MGDKNLSKNNSKKQNTNMHTQEYGLHADKNLQELSVKAIVLGIILSLIMSSANAYLGMFAGMTVSASIPAAVVALGVFSFLKKSNVLEYNIVQTAASAGECIAAGVIFSVPALVMMGYWQTFDYWEITKIAGLGGILGVLFTVPLRRALIIESDLKFPEGVATAAVMEAGDIAIQHKRKVGNTEHVESGVKILSVSAIFAGLMKLASQGFGMWNSAITGVASFGTATFGCGLQLSPCLLGVGYIVGFNIGIVVISGSIISWFFALPIYTVITGHAAPSFDAAGAIWSQHIRYLGVGAMIVGGIYSVFKLAKPLISGVKSSFEAYIHLKSGKSIPRHEKDIPMHWIILCVIFAMVPILLYLINVLDSLFVGTVAAALVLIFGFIFCSVSGYMAGLVGSSNNPLSGMTIASIVFTSLIMLVLLGSGDKDGAAASIIVGSIICCAAAIGGDNLQDLKAGHILGATPWKLQVMQMVGAVSASFGIGFVLKVLNDAYGIGSKTLPAPQAALMQSVAEGVFHGTMPWGWVTIGAAIGVIIIVIDSILEIKQASFRVPVLAAAVGIYLPIDTTMPIFLGGLLVYIISKIGTSEKGKHRGLLLASGFITGEALIGVLVAVPIFLSGNGNWWPHFPGFDIVGIALTIFAIIWIIKGCTSKKNA
jgi:putative OPT family oligopeptide transporter